MKALVYESGLAPTRAEQVFRWPPEGGFGDVGSLRLLSAARSSFPNAAGWYGIPSQDLSRARCLSTAQAVGRRACQLDDVHTVRKQQRDKERDMRVFSTECIPQLTTSRKPGCKVEKLKGKI